MPRRRDLAPFPDRRLPGGRMTVLAGVLLAGGRSSRMGRDKAGLDWHGEPLVVHVANRLLTVAATVVVAVPPGTPAWLMRLPARTEVLHDAAPDQGPVAGLRGAFAALAGRATHAVVAATDQPLLDATVFEPLLRAIGDAPVAAWRADGHLQPLGAVYRVGPPPHDARRLKELLRDAVVLDADAQTAARLRSLDTPGDYERAR